MKGLSVFGLLGIVMAGVFYFGGAVSNDAKAAVGPVPATAVAAPIFRASTSGLVPVDVFSIMAT